jgi:Sulfocyanin (SoxE) domain
MTSRSLRMTLGLVLLLTMTACGGSGGTSNTNNQPANQPAALPPAQLNIETHDFKFGIPEQAIPAGWVEITQQNNGKQPHEIQIFRLNEGVTFDHFVKATKGPNIDQAGTAVGGTGGSAGVAPGGTQTVTMMLEEGSYGVVCFVQGHHTKGMVAPLEVTAAEDGEQTEPEADDSIKAADFELFLPDNFTGQGVFAFENAGPSDHEVTFFKLDAPLADVEAYLESPDAFRGPPPGGEQGISYAGGAAGAEPGVTQYVELDLEPGVYVATCFIPGEKGKPHAMEGMATAFEVT